MTSLSLRQLGVVAFLSLAACGGGSSPDSSAGAGNGGGTGGGTGGPSPEPENTFSAAKGCYSLQNVASQGFSAVDGGSGYRGDETNIASAEAFYIQPATLGKVLFYATDRRLLTTSASAVSGNATPSDDAIWNLAMDESDQTFTIVSDASGETLTVDGSGVLVTSASVSGDAAKFKFVPTNTTCAEYPEMPLSVRGETYKGNGVDQPIIGFADLHTHQGMSSEMSYDDSVGPSAGGVLYGQVFHRFGVPHALEDCTQTHGQGGVNDANNILHSTPAQGHDVIGWPTFVDWPYNQGLTHQFMYYRWVERAYMAGLRLMVNHGTNIAGLCEFGRHNQTAAGDPAAQTYDCDDMSVAVKQVQYLYDIQDYIDAQHGGPGKGWYRIVTSPEHAREVINDGKMAVVPGVEVAQVFECGVTFLPGDQEIRQCDQDSINQWLDDLWEMGVRHIYPYHDIDSSLGGAGIFGQDLLNLLNFYDTGEFWETTDCNLPENQHPQVREPGGPLATTFPSNDPVTSFVLGATNGTLPIYPQRDNHCNARDVTDLGRTALQAIMDKRMVIDIDHAAYHSKYIMLEIAEQQTPPYPMVSTHDAHGGLTRDQIARMFASGGVVYPYKGDGTKHHNALQNVKIWREDAAALPGSVVNESPLALGYGADANGFGGHPGPRGTASERPIQYPINLFQGQGWPEHLRNLAPVVLDLHTVEESGKFWHIDEVGMAHYGLVADFVEEVRLESGEEGLTALYNSAEAYVQMWERVYNR
jgi:hypothetical protein